MKPVPTGSHPALWKALTTSRPSNPVAPVINAVLVILPERPVTDDHSKTVTYWIADSVVVIRIQDMRSRFRHNPTCAILCLELLFYTILLSSRLQITRRNGLMLPYFYDALSSPQQLTRSCSNEKALLFFPKIPSRSEDQQEWS